MLKQYQNTIKYLTKFDNTKNCNEQCTESERPWSAQFTWNPCITLLLSRLEDPRGRVVGGYKSQREIVRVSGGWCNRIFWTQVERYIFELTETMPGHTEHAQVLAWRRESGSKVLPLTKKTLHNGYLLGKGKSHSRAGPMLRIIWPTQNGLYVFVVLFLFPNTKKEYGPGWVERYETI